MRIGEITKLQNKAAREAQKEINKVFRKYSKLIVAEIENQLPKGWTLLSGNGIIIIQDQDGNEVKNVSSWQVVGKTYDKLSKLSNLQYNTELYGGFNIPYIIQGRSKDI